VLSIQSHVVHGYVGNNAATFPLQVNYFCNFRCLNGPVLSLVGSYTASYIHALLNVIRYSDTKWMPSTQFSFLTTQVGNAIEMSRRFFIRNQ